jgi:hypothetical protein
MNQDYPHDILPASEVKKQKLVRYRPLTPEAYAEVKDMTPEERAEWVRTHPIDAKLMIKAEQKRLRKAARNVTL